METKREKTRFSDEELQEFRDIIQKKLEEAREGLKLLTEAYTTQTPTTPTIHPLLSKYSKKAHRSCQRKKTASSLPGSKSSSATLKMP
jgi:hypothetical protein